MRPPCPKCSKPEPSKNGHTLGRQRWRCKACGFEFTKTGNTDSRTALHTQAVTLYESGLSSYQVANMLQVSPNSVIKWAREQTFPNGRVYGRQHRCTIPTEFRVLFDITKDIAQTVRQLSHQQVVQQ